MDITLYYDKELRFVSSTDRGKSLKNREGQKPDNLQGFIQFTLPNKINLNWKKRFQDNVEKYTKGFRIKQVNIDGEKIKVSTQDSKNLSNAIANVILQKRKPLQYDDINEETILKQIKISKNA